MKVYIKNPPESLTLSICAYVVQILIQKYIF